MWPRPRPEIIGTAPPHAAIIGASSSETLSPTPPVECLSSAGPGSPASDQSRTSPERIIAAGQRDALVAGHALQDDRHRERPDLRVAHPAVGDAADEPLDLVGLELAAVALAADELLGEDRAGGHAASEPGEEVVDERARADAERLRRRPARAHDLVGEREVRGRLLGGADAAGGLEARRGRRRGRPRAARAVASSVAPGPTLPVEVFRKSAPAPSACSPAPPDRVRRRRASRSRGSP